MAPSAHPIDVKTKTKFFIQFALTFMNSMPILIFKFAAIIAILTGTVFLSSCASNEALDDRLDKRNENYTDLQDRRGMRQGARDARSDAWFDRVMQ